MLPYLLLFILQTCASQFNSVFFYKKYQLKAGTGLSASVVYLIINGVVSAAVSLILLLIQGKALAVTPYSICIAALIVLCAAGGLACTFHAYRSGSIATLSIVSTVGRILINCLWGVLMLGETLTVQAYVAIPLMILSALLMMQRDGGRSSKRFWIFCLLVLVCNAGTALLSKQHQVETVFQTVDTLSFSIWIGIVRTVLFAAVLPFALWRSEKRSFVVPLRSAHLATVSSVISGSAYLLSLYVAIHVPIALTSPLGTGLSVILGAFLPIAFFREQLSKRQILGVLCSFVGVLIYLL